jgi:hypothetical protein
MCTARPYSARAPAACTATTWWRMRDQPRARRRGGLCALRRGTEGPRPGPVARHGAQPHGRARRRQRLVDGRAGERPGLALRAALRHRLAAAQRRADRQGAAAGAGRPLRRGACKRRTGAALRNGETGSFAHALLRPPLSARARELSGGAGARARTAGRPALRPNSRAWPPPSATCPAACAGAVGACAERVRDKELLKARLARLVQAHPAFRRAVLGAVAELNLASDPKRAMRCTG